MALVEEFLYNRLKNFAGLSALIGSNVFHVKIPAGQTVPAVSYQKISANHVESMQGSSGLCFSSFQIDAWARESDDVKAIAEQVRLALQGYVTVYSGMQIFGINYMNELDLYDDDAEEFRVLMEYVVHHSEVKPS